MNNPGLARLRWEMSADKQLIDNGDKKGISPIIDRDGQSCYT